MSNRSLIILGVLAVGMTVWAALQAHYARKSPAPPEMTYLIQGLEPSGIDSVMLSAGDKAVTLKRHGKKFVVADKDDYPAVIGKINKLIASCLDVQVSERVTGDPENHKALEITEDNAGMLIRFLDAGGKLITGLAVGKRASGGAGSYVRALGSDDVYVCKDVPYFSTGATDYMDKSLLAVEQAEVESIKVSGPKGSYTLRFREKAPQVVLDKLPAGKKLKEYDAKAVAGGLDGLSFTDVMKCISPKAAKLKFDRKLICRLTDSTVYTLEIAVKDGGYFLTCTAEFTDAAPVMKKQAVESKEELKKKEAKLLARDKAKALAERCAGLVYEVSKWQAENLTKDVSALLEDAKPATKPAKKKKGK